LSLKKREAALLSGFSFFKTATNYTQKWLAMNRKLTEVEVQILLDDLCVQYGFCLAPAFQKRLRNSPPMNVDRFIGVVYRAEGLNPDLRSNLYEMLRARVLQAFEHPK